MIDKLERGCADVRLGLGGLLEGNVACYIESSMAFPAANHDAYYLVRQEFYTISGLRL